MSKEKIFIFDTTLRDGAQTEGVDFSVEDKNKIAKVLSEVGVDYIEGGWPGANPIDTEFFSKPLTLGKSIFTAFGMTKKTGRSAENDPSLSPLINASCPAVCVVGKAWDFHVKIALGINNQDNLENIKDTAKHIIKNGKEFLFDAEHFFDGYKSNPNYALDCLKHAFDQGARWLVLCDTNGGTLPHEVGEIVSKVTKVIPGKNLGIHAHNDSELAVANSLQAVRAGAEQVQGTVNGIGERCGNANLISIIPNLKIKMEIDCISDEQLKTLKDVSAFVDELANKAHWNQQPFVGKSAFAHKGGVHVSAVRKNSKTYEHVQPEIIGNSQRILISDLSGKSNVMHKAKEFGIDIDAGDPKIQNILETLKKSENLGFQYEGAEASFELLMRDALGEKENFFEFIGFKVIVEKRKEVEKLVSEATVKLKVNGVQEVSAAEGTGPVNALDKAIKKALVKFYPELNGINLYDYKVRILEEKKGTRAKTRVLIESGDQHHKWGTVGVSENIIEASWQALIDSIAYKLNSFSKSEKNT